MNKNGFTLLEMLAVVAMTGILAASAFGGYSKHLTKKDESVATKEIYELAQKLEIHRGNNFSYAGFTPASIVIPTGATGTKVKYTITINDASSGNAAINASTAVGRDYIIRAVSRTNEAHSFFYNSQGKRCKNKTRTRVTISGCGTAAEGAMSW